MLGLHISIYPTLEKGSGCGDARCAEYGKPINLRWFAILRIRLSP